MGEVGVGDAWLLGDPPEHEASVQVIVAVTITWTARRNGRPPARRRARTVSMSSTVAEMGAQLLSSMFAAISFSGALDTLPEMLTIAS
jgi:hypothetical protein